MFICRHNRILWPVTPGRREGQRFVVTGQPYADCPDCHRRFAFNAVTWTVGREITKPKARAAAAGKGKE